MIESVVLLLVEDEVLIASVMQEALQEGGYTVRVEATGTAAMRALDDACEEICGLITDIRLPGGPDGWEIARHARELKPDISVVYMSGDSVADWSSKGVPRSLVLQKPFAAAQLITAISGLLIHQTSDPLP